MRRVAGKIDFAAIFAFNLRMNNAVSSFNRFALLRYHILDACFVWTHPADDPNSSKSAFKKMFKQDLLDRINACLKEASPGVKPIAMRTLEKDIADMQVLYGVQIVKHSENKRAYYAYAAFGMSIGSASLSVKEQSRLQRVLLDLSRFRGMAGFEWWTEMEALLRYRFNLIAPHVKTSKKRRSARLVAGRFVPRVQEKQTLRWMEDVVNALHSNQPVRVSFTSPETNRAERHSMLIESLVEQSSGWMILALVWDDEAQEDFRLILPLDAITSLDDLLVDLPEGLRDAIPFPWSHYVEDRFELVPGVVLDAFEQPISLRLWFENQTAQGYLSQPFHNSQDLRVERSGNGIVIHAALVPNEPFMQWMLQHGASAQILEPADLREKMSNEVRSMAQSYAKMFGP
tara:strand:+ start:6238 stop:7440 length:1203 start_codon:yes stop_codon:yes gene_type:complete